MPHTDLEVGRGRELLVHALEEAYIDQGASRLTGSGIFRHSRSRGHPASRAGGNAAALGPLARSGEPAAHAPTARPNASYRRSCANGHAPAPTPPAPPAPERSPAISAGTTDTDRTQPPEPDHRSAASYTSVVTTPSYARCNAQRTLRRGVPAASGTHSPASTRSAEPSQANRPIERWWG